MVNSFGAGQVYYVGCHMEQKLMLVLIDYVLKNAGVETINSPEGIEVSTRTMNQRTLKVGMNHNEYPVQYGCFELEPFKCVICEQ